MHSLFSRARTTSTKNLPKLPQNDNNNSLAYDDFGRVQSRTHTPTHHLTLPVTPSRDKASRQRTSSATNRQRATPNSAAYNNELDFRHQSQDNPPQIHPFQDSFLPTSTSPYEAGHQPYGYLAHDAHIVLSIQDVSTLVDVITHELSTRGLTTPFLFSNTALDITPHSIRRLIHTFLYSVNPSLPPPNFNQGFLTAPDFTEEAKYAEPHDLGMVLRWGLARIVRVSHAVETRGFISWDSYVRWRSLEQDSNFDRTGFLSLLPLLPQSVRSLSLNLFTFLAKLLAHSTSSGLTPSTLASLFGPLLFGLGAGTAQDIGSFRAAYSGYLRSCHATEHLLLSFVRLQIAQTSPSSPPPRRMISWVQGYPSMVTPFDGLERPRKGVKTTRVANVRRNVRLYSEDLVRTCVSWAKGPEGAAIRNNREWERIAPPLPNDKVGDRMEPKYSDAFKKKMDLPLSFVPLTGSSSTLSTPSLSTTSSTTSTKSTLFDDNEFGLGLNTAGGDEARFRSLTDMRWGEFEMLGFSDGDKKKLQFDLNESARSQRNVKRSTLTWADFSAAGFTRSDSSLSDTLQFSQPVSTTIQAWPVEKEDLHRKLKKTQKALPSFGWETSPVMDGREEVIEEGFVDVFCDLLYGGGWMDRNEGTFRECNWALVEFKALPTSRSENVSITKSAFDTNNSIPDPRISTALLLFEEFVPYEYRESLLSQGTKPPIRTRLLPSIPSILSPNKKNNNKQWKPAATLNGKPYIVGTVPRSSNAREAEFERLLAGGGGAVTKVLTLDTAAHNDTNRLRVATPEAGEQSKKGNGNFSVTTQWPQHPNEQESAEAPPPTPSKGPETPTKLALARVSSPSSTKKSRFRFPGTVNKSGLSPAEAERVEFETRLASYSDDELNSSEEFGKLKGKGISNKDARKSKRLSKDDAWVDILVASNNSNRLGDQDAEMRMRSRGSPPRLGTRGMTVSGGSGGRSDPELAREEVHLALEALKQHPPTDDEADPRDVARERTRIPRSDPEPVAGPSNIEASNFEDASSFVSQTSTLQKKRVGYFDLHPERKKALMSDPHYLDAELRDRGVSIDEGHFHHSEGDYEHDNESAYGGYQRDTTYSVLSEVSSFEPTDASIVGDVQRRSDGDLEVPAFIEEDARIKRLGNYRDPEPAKGESMTLPLSPAIALVERQIPPYNTNLPLPTTAPLNIASPKPSRLPVRSSSLPKEELLEETPQTHPIATIPPAGLQTTPSSQGHESESDELSHEEGNTPERSTFNLVPEAFVRSTTPRYVHGAPLHNVIEEEEE